MRAAAARRPRPQIPAHARGGRSQHVCTRWGEWCVRGAAAYRTWARRRPPQKGRRGGGGAGAQGRGGARAGTRGSWVRGSSPEGSPLAVGGRGAGCSSANSCADRGDARYGGRVKEVRNQSRGAAARTVGRGMMVALLREGEEAGVELVLLPGLVESSCGDVGKAHVSRGLQVPTGDAPGLPAGRGRSYLSRRLDSRPGRLGARHLSGAGAPSGWAPMSHHWEIVPLWIRCCHRQFNRRPTRDDPRHQAARGAR